MTKYFDIKDKGRGGFAKVIIVKDEIGDQYAKKIFLPMDHLVAAVGEEHLKRRFKREIKYQSRVKHLNVVAILDSYLDEEPPYFIMPLAICTLQEELKDYPFYDGNYKKVLFDVLAGLECLHELGYVHRDLKPANILKFESEEGEDYYSISDFGLMSVSDSDSSTLTGSNAQGGTQNYAAPELMRNFKAATFRADIYSFGAILHDIFGNGARRIPYTELSIPGPIGEIVNKCTKANPVRRYKSIAELRDDIYKVLDTTDVEFSSTDEQQIVEMLNAEETLSDEQWDDIFLFIDEQEENLYTCRLIFRAISIAHIAQLGSDSPELFNALGSYFATFIQSYSFDFDYCDILVGKAEWFYDGGELGLKAKITLAVLELGTSHNRWYVEKKFLRFAGPGISDNLAERIISEIEVDEFDFERKIRKWEHSISVSRNELHPILVDYLRKCG